MNLIEHFAHPIIYASGWTIVHSTWQILILFVLWLIVKQFTTKASSPVRYHLSVAVLVTSFAIIVANFVRHYGIYKNAKELAVAPAPATKDSVKIKKKVTAIATTSITDTLPEPTSIIVNNKSVAWEDLDEELKQEIRASMKEARIAIAEARESIDIKEIESALKEAKVDLEETKQEIKVQLEYFNSEEFKKEIEELTEELQKAIQEAGKEFHKTMESEEFRKEIRSFSIQIGESLNETGSALDSLFLTISKVLDDVPAGISNISISFSNSEDSSKTAPEQ